MTESQNRSATDTIATDPRDLEALRMLRCVLNALVDRKEQLVVVPLADANGISFQVHSAPEDVGRLIGKNGRTARAIRTILSGHGARQTRRYSIDFRAQSNDPRDV